MSFASERAISEDVKHEWMRDAAPELYGAACEARDILELLLMVPSYPPRGGFVANKLQAAIAKAEKAIAKAEGKTPDPLPTTRL